MLDSQMSHALLNCKDKASPKIRVFDKMHRDFNPLNDIRVDTLAHFRNKFTLEEHFPNWNML